MRARWKERRRESRARVLATGLAFASALALVSPSDAEWRGFKSAKLTDSTWSVSYTPKTVFGKVPQASQYLVSNVGHLCIDEGFAFVRLSDIQVGNKYQGIKQVTATAELFERSGEALQNCYELAKGEIGPNERGPYRKPPEAPTAIDPMDHAAGEARNSKHRMCDEALVGELKALRLSDKQIAAACSVPFEEAP